MDSTCEHKHKFTSETTTRLIASGAVFDTMLETLSFNNCLSVMMEFTMASNCCSEQPKLEMSKRDKWLCVTV